ncbi:conjugal transfer protein TraH [Vreelandella massiliensis]|uniref:conjugal transfer protein TraH n=1 Tax=Vreelandella massiliensis TaxID=1816686 RepID=UPI00096A6DD3|nr:conjugal transfer protein TraH [Halomonas massiliensis]
MTLRVKPLAGAIALASFTLISATAQATGVNETISGMFDGMVSHSPAGKWETQSRGVISGGGMRVRSPVMEEQLVNIQMPSADASCGGIDLFGGSFSFVDSDQLTQIGRAIISNAKNMAFKLGLEVVSPKIAGLMQEIENTVRELNALSMNSCEMAQGIMAPGAQAIERSFNVDMGLTGQEGQAFDDFFDSFSNIGDGSNTESAISTNTQTQDDYNEMVGNIFWTALQDADVGSWSWVGNGSNNEIMEMVQSVTGTVIVGQKGSPDEERDVDTINGQLNLYSFVFGGDNEQVVSCNNYSECDSPTATTQDVEGMSQLLEDALLGSSSSSGLIAAYGEEHNPDSAVPQSQQNLMTSLPFEFGARMARLAPINQAAAEHLAREFLPLLSLEMSVNLVRAQLRAARTAANNMDSPHRSRVMDLITEATDLLHAQTREIQVDQNVADMEAMYRALLQEADVPRHHLSNTNPDVVGTN